MTGTIAIRQATVDDLPRLKEIIASSFPWFFRSFAVHSISDLDEPTLVSEVDDKVVGFAKQIQFNIKQVRYGCILWIAVDPQHRRRGIALALTTEALEWQKSRGARAVFASTQRSNKAALGTLGRAEFVRMDFGGLRWLFGWRLFQFLGEIWFAPSEVVLAHF